jgi:hypothetical protein
MGFNAEKPARISKSGVGAAHGRSCRIADAGELLIHYAFDPLRFDREQRWLP